MAVGPIPGFRSRSWRGLIASGIAVALLVTGPLMITAWRASFVEAAGGGAASCSAFGFYPYFYDDVYTTVGVTRRGSADTYMFCALSLPHGKTVTAVKFQLYDESPAGEITGCYVTRVKLAPPDGSFQRLAGPVESGDAFSDGYVVRSDTTITNGLIDNKKYAYFAECLSPTVMEMGIVGVTIAYS